ncbi:FAD-dependent oxidoreductase [Dysgonomonas sp. Marseille-P4361]|uniref:FAD-dependent oxidoreductase n=1 Tax=Dysgonomonas sp. Marseille-P4361 TaxID=2161820 RepID=UPI0035185870
MENRLLLLLLVLFHFVFLGCNKNDIQYKVDVLVVGGSASGVAASVQASRMAKDVLLIEETSWLGGMLTSAGVSAIDGNKNLPSGFFGEFRDSLSNRYGSLDALKTGWVSDVLFEPSVGNAIFHNMVAKEKALSLWDNSSLISVEKKEGLWYATVNRDGKPQLVIAKVLIDATELGDVAKMCGVAYQIGMDKRETTGEEIAPDEANDIIQDLTYVAILKDYGKDVTIARPEGYDSTYFACAAINDICIEPKEPERMWSSQDMINYGKLPNNKYMINWPIEGNDYYLNLIELSKEERTEELKKAKNFTLSFLYFIQKELGFNTLGLADDEYPTSDLLPFIPYYRESRRIEGVVQFNLNHIVKPYSQPEKLYRTSVAVGDYPVDHHHARYKGYDDLPNLYFHPIPSYGLPLGALIPKEVDGLIVAEKSISVTNLVNGTTRLQPVVLQVGQAAGVLAALAVDKNIEIREVSVRDVQAKLLEENGYLLPYLDVAKDDKNFKTYQRIGATGILQGEGRNVGWANETWLRINDPLLDTEISGLTDIYPYVKVEATGKTLSYREVFNIINKIGEKENIVLPADMETFAGNMDDPITRGQFAVLVDRVLDPFNSRSVDLHGDYK